MDALTLLKKLKTLVIGICIIGITFMYQLEGKASLSSHNGAPPDTITSVPVFMDKSAIEGLRDVRKYYGIHHPDMVYAKEILETEHFKSVGCLKHNNFFGLYNSKTKKYCRFNNWSESIVVYKDWIQRRYKPPNDYYRFLERVNYASDPLYM